MKKSLIALALASAISAPAFAEPGNAIMYGQIDMSVNSVDNDSTVAGADERIGGVSSNNSRFGIKGSEDLGGGLKGIWQFEQTLLMDGDGGSFGSLRNTFLGLAGKSWGSVKLGNNDTPYKTASGRMDLFVDTYGDYNAIIGSITGGSNVFDVRQASSVMYESPSFGGFNIATMYGFRNEASGNTGNGAADDAKLYSLAANYANGPLFVSLAYEQQKGAGVNAIAGSPVSCLSSTGAITTDAITPFSSCASGTLLITGTPTVAASSGLDRKGMKLGLGYNFGSLVLNGVYERLSSDTGLLTSERDAWLLGAGYTMGNMVLKAQYAKAGESDAAAGNDGAKYYVLGADYLLSKRTKVYALYTALDNDTNASYFFGNTTSDGFASFTGTKPSTFALGMRHSF